jgi:CBS domain containing-hemolysin-like protein
MAIEVFLTIFLVLLNGFFVAAEFSIVKVRYSQIQLKAEQGDKMAKKSEHIIQHLDTYLSATQLGITLASLALGWVGEPVVAKMIGAISHGLNLQISEKLLHQISVPVGFFIISTLHIVFGELAPKSIAIRKAEATTLAVSYPLYWFFIIFKPFIWLMNKLSNVVLNIIGIKPAEEHESHSIEELRLLIEQSKQGGEIQQENYEIIKNAFDFTDHLAKQIMIPRQKIFSLDVETPMDELLQKIIENGYSRIPIFEKSIDNIVGIIYAKEVFKKHYQNSEVTLNELLHPVYYVYETKRISEILAQFQKDHTHIAIVIDEFGGTQGMISLEDILEELVGEIQDEDDDEKQIVERKEGGLYLIQATQSVMDINEFIPIPIPINDNYTSLSGYILYHLNRIPKIGEKIKLETFEITITKIHQRAIQQVELKCLAEG